MTSLSWRPCSHPLCTRRSTERIRLAARLSGSDRMRHTAAASFVHRASARVGGSEIAGNLLSRARGQKTHGSRIPPRTRPYCASAAPGKATTSTGGRPALSQIPCQSRRNPRNSLRGAAHTARAGIQIPHNSGIPHNAPAFARRNPAIEVFSQAYKSGRPTSTPDLGHDWAVVGAAKS